MWTITIISLASVLLIGAIFFIDCKIVEDLPDSNSFKKWWKRNVIDKEPPGF